MNPEDLFREHLQARVLEIHDLSVGVEQEVRRVHTDRGIFVIKRPLADRSINLREEVATRLCRQAGVPAPRVLWREGSYLVEEWIEGEPLDRASLTVDEKAGLFRELGALLGRMHRIRLQGFGRITEAGRGEADRYLEFYLESAGDKGLLAQEGPARRYFEAHRHYLDRDSSVLIHFDMEEEHVLVRERRIVGLVDFASAFAGSPMEEFTRMYGLRWKDPLFESLLEGYGDVDREELRFFTFLHLHWRIPWHMKKGNRPEKVALLTGLYRKIVGR
ncbi:MAG: aminoglycoside phosphotransferase family protein [Candidatus Riflebacteria bacterium]|nr:aminoglycoside phosphotransferase family protein [Candidatus Riflebacteria bacterium]